MDRKHRSGLSTALKRQRDPLSDTEDNVPSSEVNDVQKRRRLKLLGEENFSPNKSSSSRDHLCCAELEEGLYWLRDASDPGSGVPSIIIQEGFKENHLIGEAEFSSRVERFNAPTTRPASPLPGNWCPRTLSNAVTNLQLKLEDSETPSSKQASCIRQEREEELRLLRSQPIAENVFLKRTYSDSSLTEQADLNVTGDETLWVKDGSFTDTSVTAKIHGVELPIQDIEAELSSQDKTNTAEMIDLMFKDMLEAAAQGREEEEGTEDYDTGIATVMRRKEKTDTELDKEKAEEGEDLEETRELDSSADELLTLPPSCILSPLSRSVEAVVTPMRLAASQPATPPSLPLTPEELTTPPAVSVPLYSIDAYRTQRQSTKPAIQSVTPGLQRCAAEKSRPQQTVNTKDRIMVLNEEAAKLQMVINQTLQALSCCTDEDHGRGSLEEAEKLLLVSCEKRAAMLAEVSRLRERGVSGELEDAEGDSSMSQQPCRGTVSINSVQLPLKVEFVCSARTQTGRPTHYFFVLIRYGPCNIVATPLATAADAQNGDTISFPTSITLEDIHSNFEIDVEVYSLSHTSGNTCDVDLRSSSRSRITPRKLLSTIKRSNHSVTSSTMPALNTRRTSHFALVGSHKISLASLGQSKFPLDKVPFISPLEGNIYLRLDSESHSNVQHQGFLTMFEVVNGFGAWHRRFFVLEGSHMSYWDHPSDQSSKAAEGSISLFSSSSQSVKPVKRDSCARAYTFELVSGIQTAQQDDQRALAKCWFSADTREDRGDWMEKLNQVLLDLHTWTHRALNHAGAQPNTQASSGNIRESSL